MKIKVVSSVAAAILLGLSGCSSDGGSDVSNVKTTSGVAIDGLLSGATVCIDTDNNALCSDEETSNKTTTDAQGNFSITSNASGPLVAVGGTDLSTNQPFTGTLKAPAGSKVITPLTSVVQAMVENGKSVEEAKTAVTNALGLNGVDITSFDPINSATTDADNAKKVLAVQAQIQTISHAVAATVANADTDETIANTMDDAFKEIASQFESATEEVTLSAGTISSIITETAKSVYTDTAKQTAVEEKANDAAKSTYVAATVAKESIAASEDFTTTYDAAITVVNTTLQTAVESAETNATIPEETDLDELVTAKKEELQAVEEITKIETAVPSEVNALLALDKNATVADAKNMFGQLREAANTFVDFENLETNSSTIVGTQATLLTTKMKPAVDTIIADFDASAQSMQTSLASFDASIETNFQAVIETIGTRIDALVSQIPDYEYNESWTVTAGSDTLSHSATVSGTSVTETFTLNGETLTLSYIKNQEEGADAITAVTTNGSITLSGEGYSLSVTEIALASKKATFKAAATISGQNSASMALNELTMSFDLDTAVDNINMFQNIDVAFEGTIISSGRTLEGALTLSKDGTHTLSGTYTGASGEPMLQGSAALQANLNTILDDEANNKESWVDRWQPLMMIDGKLVVEVRGGGSSYDSQEGYYESSQTYTLVTHGGMEVNCNRVYRDDYNARTITNTVTCDGGKEIALYSSSEDKVTVTAGGAEYVVDNAWYNWGYDSSTQTNYSGVKMYLENVGEAYVANNKLMLDGAEFAISNITVTPNKNMFDRTFDAKIQGTLTHGTNKVAASIGINNGAATKIYAQNVEIAHGSDFVKVDELSATIPSANFLKFTEGESDFNYWGFSNFENVTMSYEDFYSTEEDIVSIRDVLDAKLQNLRVAVKDADEQLLTLNANLAYAIVDGNSDAVFDGTYEYRETKFVGHIDLNGKEQEDFIVGKANVYGTVEANGFIPFGIKANVVLAADKTAEGYAVFTRNTDANEYKLGVKVTHDDTSDETEVTLGDSNGVRGAYSTTTKELQVTNQNDENLATYGASTNGNTWEITYSDSTSETLF